MSKYASGTEVTAEKSRAEIERTLARYGATAFAYGWTSDRLGGVPDLPMLAAPT